MSQQENRLVPVTHVAWRQRGLVLLHEEDAVPTWNSVVIDDDELRPVDRWIEADFGDPPTRCGTAHRNAPQAVVDGQIVDVLLAAGELGEPFTTLHRSPPGRCLGVALQKQRLETTAQLGLILRRSRIAGNATTA